MTFCQAWSSQLLKGKRVLVTGGGRGIGRAIALICYGEGADVVITSRTQSELEDTVRLATASEASNDTSDSNNTDNEQQKQLRLAQSKRAAALLARRGSGRTTTAASGRATSVGARRTGGASAARTGGRSSVAQIVDAVKTGSSSVANATPQNNNNDNPNGRMVYRVCDVTDESEVDSLVQAIVREEGDIDVVINNAGGSQSPKGPVGTLEGGDFERLLKLNVLSPQLVVSAVCKHSASWKAVDDAQAESDPPSSSSQKVILNISSKAGKVGLRNYSFYVASKFALEGLASSWSKELAASNVRVHSLSPGMVDTKSFPKPAGKKGVREASSIKDCLLFALTGRIAATGDHDQGADDTDPNHPTVVVVRDMMDYTGHYIHVDEYDRVVCEQGVGGAHRAWKPIDEVPFCV